MPPWAPGPGSPHPGPPGPGVIVPGTSAAFPPRSGGRAAGRCARVSGTFPRRSRPPTVAPRAGPARRSRVRGARPCGGPSRRCWSVGWRGPRRAACDVADPVVPRPGSRPGAGMPAGPRHRIPPCRHIARARDPDGPGRPAGPRRHRRGPGWHGRPGPWRGIGRSCPQSTL